MVESEDEGYVSKPMFGIYSKNNSSKTIAHNNKFIGSTTFSSSQMKRSVRSVFSLLLFIVVAVTFGCRAAIRNGFGSIYGNNDYIAANYVPQFDLPVFNSTLIKLAEIDVGEPKLRIEIDQLMEGHVGDIARLRTFAAWRRFFRGGSIPARTSKGVPVNPESPECFRVWSKFRRSLGDWSRKKRFNPNIMDDLVDLVKIPIDNHNGLFVGAKMKYSSCAVVGNSGILLSKEYGGLIDSHEAVIRLNNARIESYQRNVGSKTSISFVNSNILHLCARKEDCFCHPYGSNTPIVMYMCQPLQFLDYVVCNSSHKAPLIVTDPRFDMLCARIVKYYSLKRFADAPNKTLEQWNTAHDGSMFHYSSGMQAVMLSLGICDRVSLFGFGKSTEAKHHYHTNQKAELNLHDYLAEYDLYHDLVHRPRALPFVSNKFNFPPVVIHR